MKLCFVIPTLTSGGAERVVSTLSNYWSQKGWSVTILVLDKTQFKPFYSLSEGVKIESLELFDKPKSYLKKTRTTLKQILRLRKKFQTIKPQVIISFIDVTSLLAISASLFMNVKLIVSERSNPYKSSTNAALKYMNRRFFFRFADRIVLQTEQLKAHYAKHLKNKTMVIPNPVTRPPEQYKRSFGRPAYQRVVTVGRIDHVKGQDILIRAFAKIKSNYPDWRLVIIGEGGQQQELEQLCKQLDIEKEVQWYGKTNNVYEELARADIFVLSSRLEGFPNALCEAMACGLAVIATDCDFGPGEIIQHGHNGLLVPVENVSELAQAMSQLIEDADLRARLGSKAENIVHQYSVEAVSSQWESLVKELSAGV